ncbi:MAG TPA: DUF3536 domain-containing protein [Acidimicrobiales bacterium]
MPRQPSAAPHHDWNERVTAECYRPNGWARILDDHGRIVDIVDNYERLSFNVGPTLLSWLETHAPETYGRIVAADRAGRRAIAQAYGHAILPLCNDRDLRTHIRWGLADFRHRFGRPAEGMWLPETAVDDRVLATLAEEGVGFTILAPAQIAAVRPRGHGRDDPAGDAGWRRLHEGDGADLPGAVRWRHPDDPSLGVDLVVYDGPISHDVAFGGFPSQVVVDRIVGRGRNRGDLVSVACDGETFGHHHTYADRGVAHALTVEAPRRGVALPRLADWLAEHPPAVEARVRLSAWSCTHGVGRWDDDCGCHTGGEPGWSQAWRRPLREALDQVRDHAVAVFERRAPAVLRNPWAARDAYVDLVLGASTVERFAEQHVVGGAAVAAGDGETAGGDAAGSEALVEALTLLESQRHALLMYTSCGWFFNDLAGIETTQILRYAACCLDLLATLGERPPVDAVLATLARAQSNDADEGDGRQVWRRHVEASRVDPGRVAAHLAMTELLAGGAGYAEADRIDGYEVVREGHDAVDRGGVAVCAGRVALTHRRTRRTTRWAYAAVHLGGLEVFGAVRPASPQDSTDGGAADAADVAALVDATRRGDRVTTLLRLVVDRFGPREFGLESALPGVGEDLLRATARGLADRFVAAYDQLRADNHDTLAALAVAGTPLPAELRGPVELALARRLDAAVAACGGSTDPATYRVVRALAREAREEGVRLSSPAASSALARAVGRAVDAAATTPTRATVDAAVGMACLARELGLDVPLDVAQERVHEALGDHPLDADRRRLLAPLARRLGLASR